MRRTTGWLAFKVLPVPLKSAYSERSSVENVIGGVIDAAETERRTCLVTFGGVIEDDVENHLNPCTVQCLNHVAKFVHWAQRSAL